MGWQCAHGARADTRSTSSTVALRRRVIEGDLVSGTAISTLPLIRPVKVCEPGPGRTEGRATANAACSALPGRVPVNEVEREQSGEEVKSQMSRLRTSLRPRQVTSRQQHLLMHSGGTSAQSGPWPSAATISSRCFFQTTALGGGSAVVHRQRHMVRTLGDLVL